MLNNKQTENDTWIGRNCKQLVCAEAVCHWSLLARQSTTLTLTMTQVGVEEEVHLASQSITERRCCNNKVIANAEKRGTQFYVVVRHLLFQPSLVIAGCVSKKQCVILGNYNYSFK